MSLLVSCALALVSFAVRNSCAAEPTEPTEPASDSAATSPDPKLDSRRHFANGVHLYEDRNYSAALAEFEAAYRQYASASALQNIALCQKQLYRYSEARESLTRLVRDHHGELESNDRASIDDAIRELANLIGSVRLTVHPANATVLLDGHNVTADAMPHPILLDVGEHVVSAEADGFAPLSRRFRVAGGHVEVPVSLKLTETTGTVVVFAPDVHTAIAIDGRPVAFARWTGRLEPGRHIVQVYREGYEPFDEQIDVEIGETTTVRGVLGDRTEPTESTNPAASSSGNPKRSPHGYYGLASVSLLVPRGHPAGFDADSDYDPGWSLGLRAGYRFISQLGFEAQVDSNSFAVQGRCTNPSAFACPTPGSSTYHLDSRRFGAAVRIFSSSETLRVTSTFGAGLVSHGFRDPAHTASGLGPYIAVEAGIQANWRHTLWEVVGTASHEGASSIHVANFRPYADAGGIQVFGLSLRIGWGEWMPSRPPLPPMPAREPAPVK